MTIKDPLRTQSDYKLALKGIEAYLKNQPDRGTEASDRFKQLMALIVEYEDANFPIAERQI
jgi:antitoxin component HigA of HigAB toxin-antitoxin module